MSNEAQQGGTFDPSRFLDQTTTDAGSTSYQPVPEGEYVAVIAKDPEFRPWKGRNDPSKSGVALDLTWSVDDIGVKQLLERDEVFVRQGIMLDLTPGGAIDYGKNKNVALNQVRDACGLNVPGQPFNVRMLTGKMAKVLVKHRVNDEQVYAEVKGVAPL